MIIILIYIENRYRLQLKNSSLSQQGVHMNIRNKCRFTCLMLLLPLFSYAAETSLEQRLERLETELATKTSVPNDNYQSTRFGSYGELHLNKLQNRNGNNKHELDLHRFVLFMSHDFDAQTRFFSELEVEHGNTEKSGVVALEQAYIECVASDELTLKAGVMVMPIGIISETHEPPTFFGVERNPVETNIIPTTWSEGGVALSVHLQHAFNFEAAITSGLSVSAGTNYAVRAGRQNVSQAVATDAAYTGRLKWTGMPGLELAAVLHHQSDITQSTDATAGGATLYETHAVISRGAFGLRALYASWKLEGVGPASLGADRQNGWYAEPSWRLSERWSMFARYSIWDNLAGDNNDSRLRQTNLGMNFWPHPDVVLKVDYQNQSSPGGQNEYDGFNLGLGYQF